MTESETRDRFLHVTDLHFWSLVLNPLHLLNKRFLGNLNVLLRRRRVFPLERAEAFADRLASCGVPDILLTGDFTSTATDVEFEAARAFVDGLARRGLRITVLPGNHDVYTFEARRKRRFERHFAAYLPEGGYPARTALAGGTSVALVPTVRPNLFSSRGHITHEDIARARELIGGIRDTTAVVAGHYPLLRHAPGYHTGRLRRLINAGPLRRALGASPLRLLYVAGHVHRFSYVRDPEHPRLEHLATGAFFHLDPRKGCFGEFSEVHVLDGGFQVFRHVYRDGWERSRAVPGDL